MVSYVTSKSVFRVSNERKTDAPPQKMGVVVICGTDELRQEVDFQSQSEPHYSI